MKLIRRACASVVTTLLGSLLLWAIAAPATAQEVTVFCNFEVDWCEALKAAYEKTTGQKAVFIRRTDGESLAQIRAEKSNPRADVVHAAESASAKALAAEGLLEAYKAPMVAELHDSVAQAAQGYPIKTVAPCEGTGYEIISSAIIKGGPNPQGARKWMDFVLSPAGQNVAITVNKFQIPSNKNAQVHPLAPKPAEVKLIKLDLDKYGSKEGRERLLSRWDNEVFKAPK